MEADARENYDLWAAGQRRMMQAAEREYRALNEALAHDPIARLMRAWGIVSTAVRFVDVDDDDEQLPFADPREVTG